MTDSMGSLCERAHDPYGLSPCPFCPGEFPPTVTRTKEGDVVICVSCSALGPTRRTITDAIEAWNARTPKPSTLDADRERIARIIDPIAGANRAAFSDRWLTALEKAHAILASPNASRGGDASYWLIELRGTPPLWSTSPTAPTGLGGFKSDVMHAHRYPTKTAAQDHLRRMPKQDRDQCFVSEHIDVGMPAQPNASNGVSAWNEAIEAAALVCDVEAAKADLFDSPSARLCKEQAEVCARIVRTLTKPLTDQKAGS